MFLDAFLPPSTPLQDIPALARAAESLGFDAVWVAETQHNPFLPCALIAEHTRRVKFGTAIAVSFARSPAVMAHTAWDLSALSGGRFILGLGTQVKAHITRRFGMDWPESPVGKLREQIAALRAFWHTWSTGEPLNQRGEYYKLTLSSPFFTPAPIEHPEIPIYIAGVNTGLARLAGEAADGFQVHPYHTPRYLSEVILPAIHAGAAKAGRAPGEVEIVLNAFVVTDPGQREEVRAQIAFYASTPSYRPVMELHGLGEVAEGLSALAGRQQWADMPALIPDEFVEQVATVAEPGELGAALRARYEGLADRITVYIPFQPGERDEFWKGLTRQLSG